MMPVTSISDVSLWNLSTQNGVKPLFSSDKTPEEYYEFQITKSMETESAIMNIGKIINMNKYKCHICNVDVPKAYSVDHINSDKHKTCKIIADTALERTKDQLNLEPINANVNIHITNTYFCEFCVSVVMKTERDIHEVSSHHIACVKHDKMLKEFATIYIEGGVSVHDKDLTITRNDNMTDRTAQSLEVNGFASSNNDIAHFDSHVNRIIADNGVDCIHKAVNNQGTQKDDDSDNSETSQKENDSSQCNRIKSQSVPKLKKIKKIKTVLGNAKRNPVKELSLLPTVENDTVHITQFEQTEQNFNINARTIQSTPEHQLSIEKKAVLTGAKPKIESKTRPDIIPNTVAYLSNNALVPGTPQKLSIENKHIQIPKHGDVKKKSVQDIPKQVGSKTDVPVDVETKVLIDVEPTPVIDVAKKFSDIKTSKHISKQPNVEIKTKENVPNNPNVDKDTEQIILNLINETKTSQDLPKEVNFEIETQQELPEKVVKAILDILNQPNDEMKTEYGLIKQLLIETLTENNLPKEVDVEAKTAQDVQKQFNVETKTVLDASKQPDVETKTVKSAPKKTIQEIRIKNDAKHVDAKTKPVTSSIADTTTAQILTQPKIDNKAQDIPQKNTNNNKTDRTIPNPNGDVKDIGSVGVSTIQNKTPQNESQQEIDEKSAQTPSTSNTDKTNIKENVQLSDANTKCTKHTQHNIVETETVKAVIQSVVPKTDENIAQQNNDTTVQVPTTSNAINLLTDSSLKKKTVKFANTSVDTKFEIRSQVYRPHGSRKKKGKRRQTMEDIKEYIQYVKNRHGRDSQFDIEVISDRNLIITAVNADTVKVLLYHFHGTDKRGVYCKVCQLHNIRDILHHQQGSTHMDKIMRPLYNKHCIRKLDDVWSHCVICNMTYVSRHNESHMLSLAHIHNLRTSIVEEVNNNEPTACPGQRRQYCNICRAYVHDLKTHVSEAHKMTLEERNKLIENSTDTAKVIQQNHLRPILNEKLLCGICDVKILKLDLIEHVVSSEHKEKYIEVLRRNNLNEIDCDTYYCIPCDDCVAVNFLTRHVSSRKHRKMLITQHFDMDEITPLHPIQEQPVESEQEKEKEESKVITPVEETTPEKAEVLAAIEEEPEIEDVVLQILEQTDNATEAEPDMELLECQAETVAPEIELQPIEIAAETTETQQTPVQECVETVVETAEIPAPILDLNKLIGLKMYDSNAVPVDPNVKTGEDPICEECDAKILNCDYAAHLYSVEHITNHSCYLRYNYCAEIDFQTVNCYACTEIFEIRYLVSHCKSQGHRDKLLHHIAGVKIVVDDRKEVSSQTDVGNTNDILLMTSQSPVPAVQPTASRKIHEFIPKKLFYQFYEVCHQVRRNDGLKCIICFGGVTIPCKKIDVINHINTEHHRHNYDQLMSFNRIRRLDIKQSYFCDLCAIPVPYFKELSHIHNDKHMKLVTPLFNKNIPRSDAEVTFEFAMQQQIKKQKKQALFLRHP